VLDLDAGKAHGEPLRASVRDFLPCSLVINVPYVLEYGHTRPQKVLQGSRITQSVSFACAVPGYILIVPKAYK
jgi:hypothetical protein